MLNGEHPGLLNDTLFDLNNFSKTLLASHILKKKSPKEGLTMKHPLQTQEVRICESGILFNN